MSRNLYIATIEGESGKSVVVLGVMEILSRRMKNVGFFRPVIQKRVTRDRDIELIRDRYHIDLPYESTFAFFHEEARELVGRGQMDTLMKDVVAKYKDLEHRCDFVLCEGTDFTGVGSAFELDFNVEIAKHLRSPVLAVINGRDRSIDEMISAVDVARQSFENQGCNVLAAVINRVEPGICETVTHHLQEFSKEKSPVYVLPEQVELSHPTVGEIAAALKGKILHGDPEYLNHSVRDYKIAAMELPHFLDYISDGTLVITPGDRNDIILGSLTTWLSDSFPNIAGLLLTGGLVPEPRVERLLEGLKQSPVPIVSVETDTYTTAMDISRVRASITAGSKRKIEAALGTFESNVNITELENRLSLAPTSGTTPIMFEYDLIERARSQKRHIVLPEGTEERILRAAEILIRRDVVDLTLLGEPQEIQQKIASLGLTIKGIPMIDPQNSEMLDDYAHTYYELRKHKGISEQVARDIMTDVSYFGTMMVYRNVVHGMVSGSVHTTQHTIRPSFEFIRTRPGVSIVSSVFLMCLADEVLVYGDCAVNPNPNSEDLADIAISSAGTAQTFGIEPRIAMLSYSTGESGKGADVEKVREATRIVKERRPDLKVEGPIQYDAAVDAGVARTKMPGSEVAGHATVFIFPDLNTGNNTYKAVQRSAGAVAIGPVLQGLNKPVNDLSRGCTVTDIVNTVAITAIQAQVTEPSS